MLGAGMLYGAANTYFERQSNSTTSTTITSTTYVTTIGSTSSTSGLGSTTTSSGTSGAVSTSGQAFTTSGIDGQIVTSPYCGRAYKPFCSSGCNYWTDTTVSGGIDLILNFTVSKDFSSTPCFTASTDLSSTPENIYCRIDPDTSEVCFSSSGTGSYPSCYRPKQLVAYTFYFYANSAYAQPYQVILAKGTCDNQQVETEEEKAAYCKTRSHTLTHAARTHR